MVLRVIVPVFLRYFLYLVYYFLSKKLQELLVFRQKELYCKRCWIYEEIFNFIQTKGTQFITLKVKGFSDKKWRYAFFFFSVFLRYFLSLLFLSPKTLQESSFNFETKVFSFLKYFVIMDGNGKQNSCFKREEKKDDDG